MSNRIDLCFENLKKRGEKALIEFITAGDPNMETTEKYVLSMFDNGADIIELGVPFSDPIAESEAVQKASLRSLNAGTTLDKIFCLAKSLREKTDKPLILTMYLNTIFKYGTERFFENCEKYEIDGVIVLDMPYEERGEIQSFADKHGVYSINTVAPTSHDRVKMIAGASKGFLYCVCPADITGAENGISADLDGFFELVGKSTSCPACIALEISSPKQAKNLSSYCDGVIVQGAVAKIIEESNKNPAEEVSLFTKALKDELRK